MRENINKSDVYVCGTSSLISDLCTSTNSVDKQSSLSPVHQSLRRVSSIEKYACEKIQHPLRYHKIQYIVLQKVSAIKIHRSVSVPSVFLSTSTRIMLMTKSVARYTVRNGIQFSQYRQSLRSLTHTVFYRFCNH